MPLVRARCRACALPLGDPPPSSIDARCSRCGLAARVRVTADGQPADFDPALSPARLLEWLAYARLAMASGTPGIALGACAGCHAPLAISSRETVTLPCPHCGEAAGGTSAEVLVDQWTEPWTHLTGGTLDVEYRLALLEDARGVSAGCPACATPTPATDPSSRCPSCGAVTWVQRGDGRVQLAARITGTRAGRPFNALVPIVSAEGMLRADATRSTGARSGSSLLGVTGVGCASAIALAILLAIAIGIAAHFAR
jgi:hypothetical protein